MDTTFGAELFTTVLALEVLTFDIAFGELSTVWTTFVGIRDFYRWKFFVTVVQVIVLFC